MSETAWRDCGDGSAVLNRRANWVVFSSEGPSGGFGHTEFGSRELTGVFSRSLRSRQYQNWLEAAVMFAEAQFPHPMHSPFCVQTIMPSPEKSSRIASGTRSAPRDVLDVDSSSDLSTIWRYPRSAAKPLQSVDSRQTAFPDVHRKPLRRGFRQAASGEGIHSTTEQQSADLDEWIVPKLRFSRTVQAASSGSVVVHVAAYSHHPDSSDPAYRP